MVACAVPANTIIVPGTNVTITGTGTVLDPYVFNAATVGTGLTPRGAWSNLVAYAEGDIVSYGGGSYVASAAGINHQPDTSPTFWTAVASKGDPGSVSWRGPWSSVTTYAAGDLVFSAGSSWRALAPSTNVTPVEGASWTMQAQKGDNGLSELAYAENTVGSVIASTTPADISGVSISFVTDGNPYYVRIEALAQLNYASATAAGLHQMTLTCWDTTGAAELFRATVRETVQPTGGMLVVAGKTKRFTSAAGVTKNLKMQAFLGPSTTTGMGGTVLGAATFPIFLSAWRA